jgi:hypothetical protein
MKKRLLTNAALFALSVALSVPAHAVVSLLPPEPGLPQIMLGKWCPYEEPGIEKTTDSYTVYRRDCSKEPAAAMDVKPHELLWEDSFCRPVRIQRLFQNNYFVHSQCDHGTMEDKWLRVEKSVDEKVDELTIVYLSASKDWFTNYLIANWYVLDEQCRGTPSMDVDGKEYKACDKARHSLTLALNRLGYCYGKGYQSHAEMEWHKCTRDSLRGICDENEATPHRCPARAGTLSPR